MKGALLFLLLILLEKITSFSFREVSMELTSYIIRDTSTYTFTLARNIDNNFAQTTWDSEAVPVGTNIVLQFPSEFSNSNILLSSCTSITINSVTKTNPTFSIFGNNFVVSNTITQPTFVQMVIIIIANVKNPQPALQTSAFIATIGSDIASPSSGATVTFSTGSLASCSAQFNRGYVNSIDNLTISLSSFSSMSSQNYIQIAFPSIYQRSYETTTGVGVQTTMTCISNINSGITCSGNSNTVTVAKAFPTSSLSSSTSFTINNILVPPTTETIDTITISTYSPSGIGYDSCTIAYSNINILAINSLSILSNSTFKVNSIAPISFSILLATNFYTLDHLILSFSSNYLPAYQLQSLNGTFINSNNNAVNVIFILISSSSTAMNMTPSINMTGGGRLLLNLSSIIASPTSAQTPSYSFSFYQAGFLKARGSISLSISPNSINTLAIAANNLILGVLSSYNISYISSDYIPASGMIRILFPARITTNNTITQITINSNAVSFTYLPQFNGISITNLPSLSQNLSNTIKITNLRNPSTKDAFTDALIFSTYYTTNVIDLVSKFEQIPVIHYTGPQTLSYVVQSSSKLVSAKNVSLMFKVTAQLGLTQRGSILIMLFKMPVYSTNTTCVIDSGTSTVYPCYITPINSINTVVIDNIAALSLGLAFNITVFNAFTNPPSTAPQAYFTITLNSQSGGEVQRSSSLSNYYLLLSDPSPFTSFLVGRTSTKNSQLTNYTFNILQEPAFSVLSTDLNQLYVTFPTELDLTQASCNSCTIDINSKKVIFTLDNNLLTTNQFSATINNVKNAPSFAPPTQNFSSITYLNTFYNYSISYAPNNYLQTINTLPSSITLTSNTKYSSLIIGSANTLILQINTASTKAFYYVVAPSLQFIDNGFTCTASSGFSCIYDFAYKIFIINQTNPLVSPPGIATITITGFLNPVVAVGQSITSELRGYTINNYLVGQYLGALLQWQPSCNFPCQTCSPSNKSACLSCFPTPISLYNYLYPSGNICLSECYSTQLLQGTTCMDCTNNCMECIGTTSTCKACNTSSSYAYFYNFTCLMPTACPLYYYPDPSFQCQPCHFPCQTCSNFSQCLSCADGAYWYENNCVSECPFQLTVTNTINKTCDICISTCATCSGQASNCTTCSAGNIRFNGLCLTNCSAPLYGFGDICVDSCVFPCLTCQVLATYCLSCSTNSSANLYLYQGKCLLDCPSSFIKNSTTHNCDSCNSYSLNCTYCSLNPNCSIFGGSLLCSSAQEIYCIKCDEGYINYYNQNLKISQCVQTLPDGYVNINWVALKCNPSCLACTNFTTNCLYCSFDNYFNSLCVATCPNGFYSKIITVFINSANFSTKICSLCEGNCLQCLNQTICQSCKANSYYDGNHSCVNGSSCPMYTYANDTLRACTACVSPCLTCLKESYCTSCINGTFFSENYCVTECPNGYYEEVSNNTCTVCSDYCSSCSLNSITCINCQISYLFYPYNNSCLQNCPTGFTPNYDLQICQNCTLPCIICNQADCYRCTNINTTYYYNIQGTCLTLCPEGYYQNNNPLNYTCDRCPQSCSTCNSSSFCLTCASGYSILSNGICVDVCPSYQPIRKNIGGISYCLNCSNPLCYACTDADLCIQCKDYKMVISQGTCLSNCPQGYQKISNATANYSYCVIIIINQTIVQEAQGTTVQLPINFPCSMAAGGFCVIALLIYFFQLCLGNRKILLFPLLSSAMAIPEILASYLSAFTYFLLKYILFLRGIQEWDIFIILFFLVILLEIINGIYSLVLQAKIRWNDSVYSKWQKHSNCMQLFYLYTINTLSVLNFKITHCIWCGIRSLPMLQNASKLGFYNRPSGISAISSLILTGDSIMVIYYHSELAVIYYDVIIVIVVSLLFSLLALRKPSDFFVHHLSGHPQFPLNKRIADSQHIMISGLKPLKHFDDENLPSSTSKHSSQFSSLISESSTPRSGNFSNRTSKKSSIRLENMSIQYSQVQSSSKFSRDDLESQQAPLQSFRNASILPLPADGSIHVKIFDDQKESQLNSKSEELSENTQNIINTNIAILQDGEDESYSIQYQRQPKGNNILPKQFREDYFDLEKNKTCNLQVLRSEESVYFSEHASKSKFLSQSRQSFPQVSRTLQNRLQEKSQYFHSISNQNEDSRQNVTKKYQQSTKNRNMHKYKKQPLEQKIALKSKQSSLPEQQHIQKDHQRYYKGISSENNEASINSSKINGPEQQKRLNISQSANANTSKQQQSFALQYNRKNNATNRQGLMSNVNQNPKINPKIDQTSFRQQSIAPQLMPNNYQTTSHKASFSKNRKQELKYPQRQISLKDSFKSQKQHEKIQTIIASVYDSSNIIPPPGKNSNSQQGYSVTNRQEEFISHHQQTYINTIKGSHSSFPYFSPENGKKSQEQDWNPRFTINPVRINESQSNQKVIVSIRNTRFNPQSNIFNPFSQDSLQEENQVYSKQKGRRFQKSKENEDSQDHDRVVQLSDDESLKNQNGSACSQSSEQQKKGNNRDNKRNFQEQSQMSRNISLKKSLNNQNGSACSQSKQQFEGNSLKNNNILLKQPRNSRNISFQKKENSSSINGNFDSTSKFQTFVPIIQGGNKRLKDQISNNNSNLQDFSQSRSINDSLTKNKDKFQQSLKESQQSRKKSIKRQSKQIKSHKKNNISNTSSMINKSLPNESQAGSNLSNVFNQSGLSQIISINNNSRNISLQKSKLSLKKSKISKSQLLEGQYTQEMKLSQKSKKADELNIESEYESEEIISQQAESLEISNENTIVDQSSASKSHQQQVEQLENHEKQSTQFRIRTKKRKRGDQLDRKRQKILYVDEKKFQKLRKSAKKIEKQQRANKLLEKTIEQQVNNGGSFTRSPHNFASPPKDRVSPAQIQKIYKQKHSKSKEKPKGRQIQ